MIVIVATIAVIVAAVFFVHVTVVHVAAIVDACIAAVVGLGSKRVEEHGVRSDVVVQVQHVLTRFVNVHAVIPQPHVRTRTRADRTGEAELVVRQRGLLGREDCPVEVADVRVQRDEAIVVQRHQSSSLDVNLGGRGSFRGGRRGDRRAVGKRSTRSHRRSVDHSDRQLISVVAARHQHAEHRQTQKGSSKHSHGLPESHGVG